MSIRVLLVDDHSILRQALRSVLGREKDIKVVGEAANGAEALRLVKEHKPDVVVMDIRMPSVNGIDATRQLTAAEPGVKVLALSTHAERHYVVQMLEAGARGYLIKTAGVDEMLEAVRAVARNDTYLGHEVAAVMIDSLRADGKADRVVLGPREREVLALLADGKASQEIAARLSIAVGTVDVHRRNIMRKLDLHTVADLTKYAIREGLISA